MYCLECFKYYIQSIYITYSSVLIQPIPIIMYIS